MKQLKQLIRHPAFLSPILVLLCMIPVFFIYYLFPFGSATLAWCDMRQQVVPLMLDFKDVLSGKSGFFLSMANAGGMNFWGVFLFFISSPFTFLVAFVSKADMLSFMNILVVLKMMACAVTASIFFKKYFPNVPRLQNAILSTMYACCGYTMLFYQNVVWLDAMYLFPLLLIALMSLIEKGNPIPYILALTGFIVVQFYLSYMIVLFIILAFGIYIHFCLSEKERGHSTALLAVGSIISLLLTGAVWVPAIYQYLQSARSENLLQSLSSGEIFTSLYTNLPLLMCTVIIFAVLPLLYTLGLMKNKKVFVVMLLSILMTIPVFIEPINKMWHTGSYQAFPVRYGYITVFLGLILAACSLSKLNDCSPKRSRFLGVLFSLALAGSAAVCIYLLLSKHQQELKAYTSSLWGDYLSFRYLSISFIILFAAYLLIILLYKHQLLSRRIFSAMLCTVMVMEIIFNGAVYMGSAANSVSDYQSVVNLGSRIKDTGFYRVKTEKKYFDVNLVGGIGYNSLSHYTSLTSEDYMYAMKKLGYSSYWMEVASNGGTELSDALLSNKYIIKAPTDLSKDDKTVYAGNEYDIVRNPLSMPLGVIIDHNLNDNQLKTLENLPDKSRMELQQYLFSTIFNTGKTLVVDYKEKTMDNLQSTGDGSFERINRGQPSTITYNLYVSGTQTLYLDCFDKLSNSLVEPVNDSLTVNVNDLLINLDYPSQSNNGLLKLGTFTNEQVKVTLGVLKDIKARSFGIYGMDLNALTGTLSSALKNQKTDLKVSGNSITGTATADKEGELLLLNIPYDPGYSAAVNNKSVQIYRVFDTFMAIQLHKGENVISVHYLPKGFIPGVTLSILGILLLIGLIFCYKNHKLGWMKATEKPLGAIFSMLFILTIFAVYILPMVIYIESSLLRTSGS